MDLWLVRHGETYHNTEKIIGGFDYGVLTEEGIKQAKQLGKYLKNFKFDEIICSDLFRTRQTLRGIMSSSNYEKEILMCPMLREKCDGNLEGRPYWEFVKASKENSGRLFRPLNGENFLDLSLRALSFLENLIKKNLNENFSFKNLRDAIEKRNKDSCNVQFLEEKFCNIKDILDLIDVEENKVTLFGNKNITDVHKEFEGVDFEKRFNEDFRENKDLIFSLGKNIYPKEKENLDEKKVPKTEETKFFEIKKDEKMKNTLDEIINNQKDLKNKQILAISHGYWINEFFGMIRELKCQSHDDTAFKYSNTSINLVRVTNADSEGNVNIEIIFENNTAHLFE